MRRCLAILLMSAVMLAVGPGCTLANSGPVYFQGYPSSGIIAVEKNSPLEVKSEKLLFDFAAADQSFYALDAEVAVVYEMYNPTSANQTVQMAFPFIGNVNSLGISQEPVAKQILIAADGEELPYEIYFGDVISYGSSFSPDKESRNYNFASILEEISSPSYQPRHFSPLQKGKLYRIQVTPQTDRQVNLEIEFTQNAAKTKVLTRGFNSYSYETESGKRTIGSRCYEPTELEILVLGEDLQLEIAEKELLPISIRENEVEIKAYLMDFVGLNPEIGDRLSDLYIQALDEGFGSNDGYCSEEDILQAGYANRMITLVYTVEFPANSKREVSVKYRTAGTMDRTKTAGPLYSFEYLFNPARNWSSFENLHIQILTPEIAPYVVESNIELLKTGERNYEAFLQKLPEEDFSFTLYEAEKITLTDQVQGVMNYRFGYFAPLVWGAIVLVLIVIAIIIWRKAKKRGKLS